MVGYMNNTKYRQTKNKYGLPAMSTIEDIFTKHCVIDDYKEGIAISPCGKFCDYGKFDDMPDKLNAQWEFCKELESA